MVSGQHAFQDWGLKWLGVGSQPQFVQPCLELLVAYRADNIVRIVVIETCKLSCSAENEHC